MNDGHVEVGEMSSLTSTTAPEERIGEMIRYLRQQLGMTQEELAQSLGITVGTVSRWEKGRFRPSRLARALIVEFARTHHIPLSLKVTRQI